MSMKPANLFRYFWVCPKCKIRIADHESECPNCSHPETGEHYIPYPGWFSLESTVWEKGEPRKPTAELEILGHKAKIVGGNNGQL